MLPNTPSQRWACWNLACRGGRKRLGSKSLAQYWATCPDANLHDLYWIARHLKLPYRHGEAEVDRQQRQARYEQRVKMAYGDGGRGRWRGKHVRGALEVVIKEFNAHFPMWCF